MEPRQAELFPRYQDPSSALYRELLPNIVGRFMNGNTNGREPKTPGENTGTPAYTEIRELAFLYLQQLLEGDNSKEVQSIAEFCKFPGQVRELAFDNLFSGGNVPLSKDHLILPTVEDRERESGFQRGLANLGLDTLELNDYLEIFRTVNRAQNLETIDIAKGILGGFPVELIRGQNSVKNHYASVDSEQFSLV